VFVHNYDTPATGSSSPYPFVRKNQTLLYTSNDVSVPCKTVCLFMGYFLVLGFGYPVLLRTGFFVFTHSLRQPYLSVIRTTTHECRFIIIHYDKENFNRFDRKYVYVL
jgi:hypothetical protein